MLRLLAKTCPANPRTLELIPKASRLERPDRLLASTPYAHSSEAFLDDPWTAAAGEIVPASVPPWVPSAEGSAKFGGAWDLGLSPEFRSSYGAACRSQDCLV